MKDREISVLLVEDNPGDARLLHEMLNDAGGDRVHLTEARDLAEAFELLDSQSFDAVLLDLGLPGSRGLDTFTAVHERYEDVPIVVLSGLDDEEVAITAVQEGAQDYLVKAQISGGSLLRSLHYAIERHIARQRELSRLRRGGQGGTIAFVGAKGGVGVSTLTVNFGAVLASRGRSTTAIEMRGSHGSFSSLLSRTPVENISHLVELGAGQISPRELGARLVKTSFGMNVLFSPQEARQEVDITAEEAGAIVQAAAELSDLTLLDIPPWPSEAAHEAMRQAWRVFLLLEPEPASVRAAQVTIDALRTVGVTGQLMGAIVVNRAALPVGATPEETGEKLGLDVLAVIPPAAEACAAAQRAGTPVVLAQPDSVYATNLAEVVDRLSGEQITAQSVW